RQDRDLFVQAARVPGALVVSAELGVAARQATAWAKGGEMRVTITTAAGDVVETRAVEAGRAGVVVRVPVDAPGGAQVDVRARAATPGDRAAADAALTMPAPGAALIGDVIAYRGVGRFVSPAADGRYRRTERATLEAPLAPGASAAGARLLDKLGNALNVPITAREKIDASGTRWIVAEAALAPLSDGDYLVEVEAMKDETRQRVLFAIRVVR
nr:hypothetical protein [Acidobacteriota bacterium]